MEKIAVIGSNSFSGSHFVNYILENTDYGVIGISRSQEPNSIFLPYNDKRERFQFYQLDLNHHITQIMQLIEKENIKEVVNFAAQGMVGQSWENPLHWYRTNVLSTIELVERLRKFSDFKKYLQISTPEIYGSCKNINEEAPLNPSSPYANSKATADIHLKLINRQFNFPVVFARSTNVYGPGQQLYRIIPISIIKIKKGEKIKLQGGGKAIKSYMHIKDACDGYFKILKQGRIGEVYHLSPERGYSIREIVQAICNKLNVLFEQAVELIDERPGQDAQYIIDSEKAKKELEWKPIIPIEQGINECIDWVNKHWVIIKTFPTEYIHKE